jgi:hypothetical protein
VETATWDESEGFLREHHAELTAPRIRELIAGNSHDDETRQHLAILQLSDTLPIEAVYQIVIDATVATERALDLVESGDLDRLTVILTIAPRIATEGITGAFLQTVLALANEDLDASRRMAALIAEHGNAHQREALAIRLRAFASHRPEPSQALAVADIIAPDGDESS